MEAADVMKHWVSFGWIMTPAVARLQTRCATCGVVWGPKLVPTKAHVCAYRPQKPSCDTSHKNKDKGIDRRSSRQASGQVCTRPFLHHKVIFRA